VRCAARPPGARPGSPGAPACSGAAPLRHPGQRLHADPTAQLHAPAALWGPEPRAWPPGARRPHGKVTRGPRPQGARAPPPPPRPRERPAARPGQDDLTRKATDELLAELRGAAGARIPFQREGPGSRPRARLVLNELARRHRLGPHPLPVRVRPAAGARVAAAWGRPRGPGHLLSLRAAPACPLRVSAQGALRPSLCLRVPWTCAAARGARARGRSVQSGLVCFKTRPGLTEAAPRVPRRRRAARAPGPAGGQFSPVQPAYTRVGSPNPNPTITWSGGAPRVP